MDNIRSLLKTFPDGKNAQTGKENRQKQYFHKKRLGVTEKAGWYMANKMKIFGLQSGRECSKTTY
jgi:hypothetical protein